MPSSVDLFGASSGAIFSPDERYRYSLWRIWDTALPVLLFLMLNPSKANASDNDPTVERCQRRSIQLGFGGLFVANLFGLVSTDPTVLKGHPDPVGPENDEAIMIAARQAGMVICGWGTHGQLNGRGERVLTMLREALIQPYCLLQNSDGSPGHPLYVPYDRKPIPLV